MSTQRNQIKEQLHRFCGSENRYQLTMFNTYYTDGIKFLADTASCYWLVTDVMVVAKTLRKKSAFLVIYFKRLSEELQQKQNAEAQIIYGDGNGTILYQQDYEFTDLPLDELRLFFVQDTLMLPGEY